MKKQIPNLITLGNLLCGVLACIHAVDGALDYAALFICAGIFFDFFDGLAARALGVSSPLGKELDSLADVITSGVAPGLMLFAFFRDFCEFPLLFLVGLLIPAFSAYRLAKFNLDERQTTSFIGLPTPANALFWGSLVVGCHDWLVSSPVHVLGLVIGILLFSYLLVAEIPLFALRGKNLTWADNYQKYIFLLGCLPCFLLGYSCFAAIIVWYVLLAVLMPKK